MPGSDLVPAAVEVAPELAARVPGLYVEALVISGVDPSAEPPGLALRIAALCREAAPGGQTAEVRTRYRWLHEQIFGVDFRPLPAVENLIQRFVSQGRFPRINPIVDAANVVSVEEGRPLGVFDAEQVKGPLLLRPAGREDRFIPLGKNKAEKIKPAGSPVLCDREKVLSLVGIRDSTPTRITETTRRVLALSWGAPPISRQDVRTALKRFAELVNPAA